MCRRFSHVWLFATPRTIACQAPLSRGFSRQEYQSGYSFPSPEDLPHPGIEPESLISPALGVVTTSATWKACRKATQSKRKKERKKEGFPGGPVVKKSACKCRVCECHPWSGKIPHVVHEATKPVCHNYWAHVQLLKPACPRACAPREATAIRSPRTTTRE